MRRWKCPTARPSTLYRSRNRQYDHRAGRGRQDRYFCCEERIRPTSCGHQRRPGCGLVSQGRCRRVPAWSTHRRHADADTAARERRTAAEADPPPSPPTQEDVTMRPIHANDCCRRPWPAPGADQRRRYDSRRVQPGCVLSASRARASTATTLPRPHIGRGRIHPRQPPGRRRTGRPPRAHPPATGPCCAWPPLPHAVLPAHDRRQPLGQDHDQEFCYAVLSAFGNTLKTEGNQNNEIACPTRCSAWTKRRIRRRRDGMSALGEIARLVATARPARYHQHDRRLACWKFGSREIY